MSKEAIIGAVGLVIGLMVWLLRLTWMVSSLNTKVETMWAFQMRRALGEAVERGIATVNSPILFTTEATKRLDPIKQQLRDLWKSMGKDHCDAHILLEIERRFGDDLLTRVCIPCQLSLGSCLLLAFSVAKGDGPLEIKL